jgi:hypothetical protein
MRPDLDATSLGVMALLWLGSMAIAVLAVFLVIGPIEWLMRRGRE